MKNKFVMAAFLWGIFLFCIGAGEINLGDRTIAIPMQEGFVDATLVKDGLLEQMVQFMPDDLQTVAGYVDRSDTERLIAGNEPINDKYILIMSPKKTISYSISPMDFASLKNEIRNQFESLPQKIQEKLSTFEKQLNESLSTPDSAVTYKFKKIIPLGIDFENDNIFSVSILNSSTITVEQQEVSFVLACSLTYVLVQEKVLCIYVYKSYKNKTDLIWAQKQSLSVAQSILSHNSKKIPSGNKLIAPDTAVSTFTQNLLKTKMQEYSTEGNPKAKGIKLIVEFPVDWERTESKRPNIVQNFKAPIQNGVSVSGLIMIKNTPELGRYSFKDITANDFKSESDFKDFLPDNAKFVRGGVTVIDGEKTIWLETNMTLERANMVIAMRSLQYFIPQNEKLILIGFSVAQTENTQNLKTEFDAYLPLFQRIMAKTVIKSKWE